MIKSRKAMMVEAFARVIIMILLVWVVINIGKTVAEAAFGGTSNLIEPFNRLVEDINKPESKEALITLEPGTAIIGFSKDKDYQCYGCGGAPKNKLEAIFKHPSSPECKDSACVCVCLKGLPSIRGAQQVLEINCEKLQCRKLNFDIYPKVELRDLIAKKYGSSGWSSWQGGFLYGRDIGEVDAAISGLPKNSQRTLTVFLEKKTIGDKTYVGVCPVSPCIQEQK